MDQFILFGDSLTQQSFSPDNFFGAALSNAYARKLDIINRGFSGYNTTQALGILPKFMPTPAQARVRFIAIFFGANDARLADTPGSPQQHVPEDDFAANVEAIVTHPCIRAHEGIRIILITPPPIDERKCIQADLENYGEVMKRRCALTTARYALHVRDVGAKLGVPVLDLWRLMVKLSDWRFDGTLNSVPGQASAPKSAVLQGFVHDGLHFTKAAYEVLFEALMQLIGDTWPDQLPENLEFVFPRWDDEGAWENKENHDGASTKL